LKTYSTTADADTVLRPLRLLPPRERLRVVIEALPELEHDLPATPPSPDFWGGADIQALAERQGVQPIADFDTLLGGWPEDEPMDGFLAAVHEWRQEKRASYKARLSSNKVCARGYSPRFETI